MKKKGTSDVPAIQARKRRHGDAHDKGTPSLRSSAKGASKRGNRSSASKTRRAKTTRAKSPSKTKSESGWDFDYVGLEGRPQAQKHLHKPERRDRLGSNASTGVVLGFVYFLIVLAMIGFLLWHVIRWMLP